MQATMIAIGNSHMDYLASVIGGLDVSMSTVRSNAKAAPETITKAQCCEHEHHEHTKAAPSLGIILDTVITTAGNQLFSDIWGTTNIHANTILQKSLYELMNESLANGYNQAEIVWQQRAAKDQEWANSNPFPDLPLKVTADMRWVQAVQDRGFTQVRNKIFQDLEPKIKQQIADGVTRGLSNREIAQDLYSKFGPSTADGSGYLWQWQRLARTEAHHAVFQANNEEYKEVGAVAVRWNAAINRCPLCEAIQSNNQGYYPIDNIPSPPHPNCRCTTTPVFTLPKAVTV